MNAGQLDIGLVRPHLLNNKLKSKVLLSEPLMLAVPEETVDEWPKEPTLDCIHGKPFVMYSPQEARPFYHMLNARFQEAGVIPDIVEHVGQVDTMLALVRAGLGAALIAESATSLQFNNVAFLRIQTEPVETIGVWRRDNDNPALSLFLEEVLPSFGEDESPRPPFN